MTASVLVHRKKKVYKFCGYKWRASCKEGTKAFLRFQINGALRTSSFWELFKDRICLQTSTLSHPPLSRKSLLLLKKTWREIKRRKFNKPLINSTQAASYRISFNIQVHL